MLLYVVAVFLSPIAVLIVDGCGCDLLINILLLCLGWIPGVIHAWWRIGKNERARPARVAYPAHRY
ncbi:hypothetical protein ACM66B_002249 [Microbotryomycetes sp. NB124-2]